MQPSLRYLVLLVRVDRDDDGFADAVRAMREVGLVGAVLGDTEDRPPDATMAFVACDDDGRPLLCVGGELLVAERAAVVADLAASTGGSVTLYEDGDEEATTVEVAERREWMPAPERWAWWIAPRGVRGFEAVRRALGSGSVELAIGDRCLAVGTVTTFPAWPREALPAIGASEDSTELVLHVRASAGVPGLPLVWWRRPLPLVEHPTASVLHAQAEIVEHMGAGPHRRPPEADVRGAMAALGRGEHADALLALLDERLEANTGERALALLGVPDALLLALRGEVDVAGLPGAVRH
ncbi:hypothetical protein [Agrococcus jejuensis]|uniref:Uncharacterized protein n=1 Tax=Agrococcus jejuensis TaxID=399736 RepID=A0A1G8DBS2_9MICO|nr:hypothetical protein [Agrococcus jejuensis]SDH55141.1 hypothetical protein SAMN04489720_1590 [Agrococcus jejuensis]